MLCEPIETRYRKENKMFHSAAFAIAAGVVGVAGAATSAGMGMAAADRAARAQGAAGRKYEKQLGAATGAYEKRLRQAQRRFSRQQELLKKEIQAINPNITIPEFDLGNATLEGIEAANQVTANTISQIEKMVGERVPDVVQRAMGQIQGWQNRLVDQYARIEGVYPILKEAEAGLGRAEEGLGRAEAGLGRAEVGLGRAEAGLGRAEATLAGQLPQIQQAREIVDTYLTGDIPETTKRQLTRAIAERAGAGFNPATAGMVGGFQVGPANLAENLRQTAEERQRYGLGMVPGITQQAAMIAGEQRGIAGQQANIGLGYGQLAGQLAGISGQRAGIAGQRAGLTADYARLAGTQAQLGEAARGWQNTEATWMDFARGFIQSPTQMVAIGLQGRGQDIDISQANIRNRMTQLGMIGDINAGIFGAQQGFAQGMYGAQTGQAQQAFNLAQQNIATNLAARQATAQGIQGITGAASGALGGIGSAYGQLATASPTTYGSMGAAQQAAPFASGISRVYGMGYVPRATAV